MDAAAPAGGWTPGRGHTLDHIQQQNARVDNIALFLALVTTAKTVLRFGRHVAKAMVREG